MKTPPNPLPALNESARRLSAAFVAAWEKPAAEAAAQVVRDPRTLEAGAALLSLQLGLMRASLAAMTALADATLAWQRRPVRE